MTTDKNNARFRRSSGLRSFALGVAVLLALLQGALFPDAGRSLAAGGEGRTEIVVGSPDLCASADQGAPAHPCPASTALCCLACGWERRLLPPVELGELAPGLAPHGRVSHGLAPEGTLPALARVTGWRSSWSAQAPPFIS